MAMRRGVASRVDGVHVHHVHGVRQRSFGRQQHGLGGQGVVLAGAFQRAADGLDHAGIQRGGTRAWAAPSGAGAGWRSAGRSPSGRRGRNRAPRVCAGRRPDRPESFTGAENSRNRDGAGRDGTLSKTKSWRASVSISMRVGEAVPSSVTRPAATGMTRGCLSGWPGVGGVCWRERERVAACGEVIGVGDGDLGCAGLVIPALEVGQVHAGGVGHRGDEIVDRDGLVVVALRNRGPCRGGRPRAR